MKLLLLLLIIPLSSAFSSTLLVGANQEFSDPRQAIDAVADGDTILIMTGVYEFQESLWLTDRSDVTIMSEQGARLVCHSTYDNVLWITNCDGILIQGISAQHAEPSEFESCVGNVIGIHGCTDITIQYCELNGCGATGLYAWEVEGLVLRENFIHSNTLWAVRFDSTNLIAETDEIDNLIMEDNTIINNGGRVIDEVLYSGVSTGVFEGATNEDGYLRFILYDNSTFSADTCWVAADCDGIWYYLATTDESNIVPVVFQWRWVLTWLEIYGVGHEVKEITSIHFRD